MTHAGKFNLEQAIGIVPGTEGAPGNVKIWEEGKKLEEKVLKKFKNKGDRIKHMVDGMYKKFGHVKGVTKTLIKSAISRFPGFLSMTPWGTMLDISTRVATQPEVMEATGISQEPLTYRGGGMADIYDMTQPLKGYNLGGPAGMTDLERTGYDRSKSSAWNINDLIRDVGSDIGTSIKSKVSGAGEKIKSLFREKQYEGGDNPYYMKFFDKHWKEGYGQEQIDMLWNTYKDDARNFKEMKENTTPSRWEYDFDKREMYLPKGEFKGAKGGIVSLNHLTRRL